jgi:hypothetical protein
MVYLLHDQEGIGKEAGRHLHVRGKKACRLKTKQKEKSTIKSMGLLRGKCIMRSDKATTPIEIGLTILLALMVLALVEFIAGSITDSFIFAISKVNMDLLPWTQGVMNQYINSMGRLVYATPVALALIFVAWGFRAIYIKQQSIRTDTGLVADEEF